MDEKTSNSRVEFKPPEGFKPPESSSPDKDWDMVCSFRTKADGTICMTQLGETKMPGYDGKEDHDEKTEHKPDYSQYSQGIMNDMSQGGMGGSTTA